MTAYSQRFALTNERAVVGRTVFLDRGQVGVIVEVRPPLKHVVTTWERRGWSDPPVNVEVAWGLKARRDQSRYNLGYSASDLGDYDQHLAYQAELLKRMVDRRKRLPGALPMEAAS